MAIDKIIQELEIRTSAADKNLDDVIKRLNVLEKEFGDVEKKANKGFKGAEKPVNNLNDTVKRLGQTIATVFAAEKIIQFTKSSIDAASDLNETISKTEQIFGDASKEVIAFAENAAEKLGQSKTQAMDAASTFATFGKSAGLSGTELANFSTDLVTLSADLASFNNTTPEEAIMAIGAALRGESEPIRRYGVLLDDASLRQEALALNLIKTTKQALTPQQKVLAAQAAIFKQTADAQGDFARTSDGVANQQRILQATFQDLQAEIGQKLLPAFNKLLKGTVDFLKELDAEDVLDFADAVAKAAAVYGAWKIGAALLPLAKFTKSLFTAGQAMRTLNVAIKRNPIGFLLSALVSVASYFFDLNDLLGETEEELTDLQQAQKEYADAVQELTENQTEQIGTTINLFDALRKTNKGSKERKELIDEINKRYGTTIKNLEDEVEFQKQLDTAQDEVIKGIKEKIVLQIQEKKYASILKQQIKLKGQLAKAEDFLQMSYGKTALTLDDIIELEKQSEYDPNVDAILNANKNIGDYKNQLASLEQQMEGLDVETKDLMASLGVNDGGDGPKAEPTLLGAFAALTAKASELQEAIRNALASGDMAGASQLTRILDDVQAKIDFLNATMEGLNKPIDINLSEPVITTEEEGEQTIDEWVASFQKNLTDNPLRVKINLDTSDSDDPTDPFGSPEQFAKIQGAVGGVQDAFQGLNDYLISAGLQNSQFQQSVAIFQITLQQAMAIAGAIRAAAVGATDPFTLIASIGAVVGAVLSTFAQVNSILNSAQQPQRPTGFFEGTDYLTRNGAPSGKDTIPAMLNEGEAVIPTADNAKYPGLAKSWINGDLDNYIYRNWVAPALSEAEAKKNESMADNLAKSIAMNTKGGFDDYRLYRTNRQGNSLLAQIADNTRPRMNKKRRYN